MTQDQIKAWVELAKLPTPGQPTLYDNKGAEYRGFWYVCCDVADQPKVFGSFYLHSNGKIYEGTLNKKSGGSGWFKSKLDALAAIEIYYARLGLEMYNGN